jgi:starch phosphorylase
LAAIALRALGLQPTVYHINEGHSAFLVLERVRSLRESRTLSFAEAKVLASTGTVFTMHTPVEAGRDYFPPELMERYFSEYALSLGNLARRVLALGRLQPSEGDFCFCMTVLALRFASHANGVSRLHGEVGRNMWQKLWPGIPIAEVPIGHITNGVHFPSWTSLEMKRLSDRYLGPGWREEPANGDLWGRAFHPARGTLAHP